MNINDNTVESLVEFFYHHCPLARAMCAERQVFTVETRGQNKDELVKLPDIEHGALAGADMDFDDFLLRTMGESERWANARMKLASLARYLNRLLYTGIDAKGLPAVSLGSPGKVKAEFVIGRDMSGIGEDAIRFARDGETILLFEDHRAFFTKPIIADVGRLDYKPVHRIRMEMYYYVLKEKDKA